MVPKRISGIFRAVSEPYIDSEPVFVPVKSRDEVFEYRVRVEPVLLPKEPIDFTPLVEKLSFIKNKRYWTAPLRRAMLKISREDYEIIEEEIRRHHKITVVKVRWYPDPWIHLSENVKRRVKEQVE